MASSEKIKTSDNNIEQNKAQYNLYRKTTDILALSSENVGKYEFLMGKDVLPENIHLWIFTFRQWVEKADWHCKDQHKYFKDQTNAINNNREDEVKAADGVKVEDDEIAIVGYFYTGDMRIWLIKFLSMD